MINYDYLRSSKKEWMKRRQEAAFPKIEVGYSIFDNSTVLPCKFVDRTELPFGRGGVIDSSGNFVVKSGLPERFGGAYPIDKTEYRDERVIYCGLFVKHWGHFLVDVVNRLWFFLEHDDGLSKYVFSVEENSPLIPSGNYRRFFELLGIWDRVEFIHKPTCFKQVVVPELGYLRMGYYSDAYKRIFDAVIRNAVATKPEIAYADKIYFSRSHFRKANDSEIGHDFLEQYFESNGFKILYPEELTLEEMICYIRNADICATPSGTLPHNFLFAQDKKKVIIVERMVQINEMQVDVDRIKELDVTYVDGQWLVYPGVSGGGPFLFGYTKQFQNFTKDNNYLPPPDNYFLSEKYKKKCLRQFVKIHKSFFAYNWGMESWAVIYAGAIIEAHEDTVREFSDYINGVKPFMFKHYFQIRYIKSMIKRMILKRRG